MCWDDTSFYIQRVHSIVKPHVLSALLRYCSLLHMWVCDWIYEEGAHVCSRVRARIKEKHSSSEWVGFSPCRVMTVSSVLLKHWPQASEAYFQLHIFPQPPAWVIWVVMTWQSNWFAQITPLVFDNLPHLLSELSGQAGYKSFTDLINCLKSAPPPGK